MLPDNVMATLQFTCALANSLKRKQAAVCPSLPFPVCLCPINFTAISRQPVQVIQTSFVALRRVSSPLSLALQLPRLHFVSFSFRFFVCVLCHTVRQAEILLPLFMLSLCNILPAAFAAVALGALVFNILQLVKALLAPCCYLPPSLLPFLLLSHGNRSRALIQITRQMVFLSFVSLLQFPLPRFGYWYLLSALLCYPFIFAFIYAKL